MTKYENKLARYKKKSLTDALLIIQLFTIIRMINPEASKKLIKQHANPTKKELYAYAEAIITKYKNANKCPNPNCNNDGYTIDCDFNGDPQQIQCEFCYTKPNSKFNTERELTGKFPHDN